MGAAVPRFIVFAHMRSGSTTLVRALGLHPDVRILNEPFNSNFAEHHPGERDYLALVTDEQTLDEQLEHMYRGHNGIKSLGYQIPWELSAHLLRDPRRHVIFLKRTNVLQTVVSGLISQQTGVWHSWDLDGPVEGSYSGLQPLSIDFLRRGVADVHEEIGYFEDVVSSRDAPTLVLTYDQLYRGSPHERRAGLTRVFGFLGLRDPSDEQVDRLLDPARTRLNSERTYAMLPNAREIDEALGCDETGFLFEPHR